MIGNLSEWHLAIVLLALVPYLLSIWAIVVMARDHRVSTVTTVLWAVVMLLVYVGGLIAWFIWWTVRKGSGTAHDA